MGLMRTNQFLSLVGVSVYVYQCQSNTEINKATRRRRYVSPIRAANNILISRPVDRLKHDSRGCVVAGRHGKTPVSRACSFSLTRRARFSHRTPIFVDFALLVAHACNPARVSFSSIIPQQNRHTQTVYHSVVYFLSPRTNVLAQRAAQAQYSGLAAPREKVTFWMAVRSLVTSVQGCS
jgi:hypothetical protein